MEFSICCLPGDVFHVTGYHGQGPGVLKLDILTQVCVVFSHSWFVRMIQPDVPVVFLDPGLIWMPAEDDIDASGFQDKVILDGPMEIGDLPSGEAYSLDVMYKGMKEGPPV